MKIELKCSIEACDQHYDYELSHTNPIALHGKWMNDDSIKGLWTGLPSALPSNEEFELLIHGPLILDISKDFWSIYRDPYSVHNGIETEERINSIRFCLCKNINILEAGDRSVKLKVLLKEIIDLKDISNFPLNLNDSKSILDSMANSTHYSIINFSKYSVIKIDAEGDVGWTFIVYKEKMKSKILIGNTWGFHEDFWKIYNEPITNEQEIKYGIQHASDK